MKDDSIRTLINLTKGAVLGCLLLLLALGLSIPLRRCTGADRQPEGPAPADTLVLVRYDTVYVHDTVYTPVYRPAPPAAGVLAATGQPLTVYHDRYADSLIDLTIVDTIAADSILARQLRYRVLAPRVVQTIERDITRTVRARGRLRPAFAAYANTLPAYALAGGVDYRGYRLLLVGGWHGKPYIGLQMGITLP